MKARNLFAAAAIAALPLSLNAATIVVPAAGTGPGASNSHWQSELTLHTVAPRPVTLALTYHEGRTVKGPVSITLHPRSTMSIDDVVKTTFGVDSGTGAIVIEVSDRDARSVAVDSRTFNVSAASEFGQNIPAVDINDASRAGEVTVLTGPSEVTTARFNAGIYSADAATRVRWELLSSTGTIVGSKELTYSFGEHTQYNSVASALFPGAAFGDDYTIHARVLTGRAIVYGSIINATGDPTFVPGIRLREHIAINFAGVDLDENGTVDVADANGDGVLDAPIDVFTSMFGNYFRVVATGEFGEPVTYEVVAAPAFEVALLDSNGTLRVLASGNLKETTGMVEVRVTAGTSSSVLVIPVRFR